MSPERDKRRPAPLATKAFPARYGRIAIRPTVPADLPFVLQTEGDRGNARFVAQWSEAEHRAACDDPSIAHGLIEVAPDIRPVGYVIVCVSAVAPDCVELRRIALAERGQGFGREALRLVKTLAFDRLAAGRLWLDVRSDNRRARRLYESEGFVAETPSHDDPGGAGLIVMSLVPGGRES